MNKEKPVKSGLVFGIGMSIFFIIRNLFSLDDYSDDTMLKAVLIGILAGLISGLVFWLLLVLLKKIQG